MSKYIKETYKFYKDEVHNWYIDLPSYPGPKADLQMVMGADTMLDLLSQGNGYVYLYISDLTFIGSTILEFKELTPDLGQGANYKLISEHFDEMNVWLCDVVKFIFGNFPEKIYFVNQNIDNF